MHRIIYLAGLATTTYIFLMVLIHAGEFLGILTGIGIGIGATMSYIRLQQHRKAQFRANVIKIMSQINLLENNNSYYDD